jgi:hypothetical protein
VRHPNVPESLDGWTVLHRMFRFDRRGWDARDAERASATEREARELFTALSCEGELQAKIDKLALRDYLEPRGSYVSIVELGLYAPRRSTPS